VKANQNVPRIPMTCQVSPYYYGIVNFNIEHGCVAAFQEARRKPRSERKHFLASLEPRDAECAPSGTAGLSLPPAARWLIGLVPLKEF
jgi:hypothetical protein